MLLQTDRFGYEVEMHYQGSSSFKTYFGAVISCIFYVLIFVNSLNLLDDYFNSGNQTEINRRVNVDINELGELDLNDNMFYPMIVYMQLIPPTIGSFTLSQANFNIETPGPNKIDLQPLRIGDCDHL